MESGQSVITKIIIRYLEPNYQGSLYDHVYRPECLKIKTSPSCLEYYYYDPSCQLKIETRFVKDRNGNWEQKGTTVLKKGRKIEKKY